MANHLVQQFEIAVYKSCDCWDVLLALGGLLLSDPRAPSLIEAIVQQLHSGYARLPGAQQRVFQPSFDAVVLRVSMLSCAEEHRMLANNTAARLQLTYLEDCFRFYHAIAGTSVEGLCDAAHDRLQARRGEIMARIGQSLVALTLWFLYQAIKIHSWRSTPSQGLANAAAGEAVQPGGAVGGGAGGGGSGRAEYLDNFVLSSQALSVSKELLVQYRATLTGAAGPRTSTPAPDPSAPPLAAHVGVGLGTGIQGPAAVLAPPPAENASTQQPDAGVAGEAVEAPSAVLAPPALVDMPVAAPPPLEAVPTLVAGAASAGKAVAGDAGCLQYGLQDVDFLIEALDLILGAHGVALRDGDTVSHTSPTPATAARVVSYARLASALTDRKVT